MNPLKTTLPEQVSSLLERGEPMTAAQLCAATGKSQPSISLALQTLGDRVCKIGAARSSRYALKKDILGLPATQPLIWTAEDGAQSIIGQITHLSGGKLLVQVGEDQQFILTNQLPWYLQPFRLQGFLGRQLLRYRLDDMPQNPEELNVAQTLRLMAEGWKDPPGAITLGTKPQGLPSVANSEPSFRLKLLESLVNPDVITIQPKSSAGGEQPKFAVVWAGDPLDWGQSPPNHEIVKFTPPHGTPFGERWKALLKLEHLAQNLLQKHGIESAITTCFHGEKRFFLSSQRFDRIGIHGKRHVVAIAALHEEFTPGPLVNWVHTAEGLHAKKLITKAELHTIATIHAFGHYIGNTDMHFGNLSFFVDDVIKPKIRLAPVYDMLPMMWRPDPHAGLTDSPVRPQPMPAGFAAEQEQARQWAIEFWEQAALLDIGADLQAASLESARRLKNNFASL